MSGSKLAKHIHPRHTLSFSWHSEMPNSPHLSIVEGVVLRLEFEGGGMKEEWSKEDIQMEGRGRRK